MEGKTPKDEARERRGGHSHVCAAQGIWSLIKRSQELGLQLTVSIFRQLASACGNKSSFYALREVLPAHLEAGLPLGRGIINSIISACGKTRRIEYAWVRTPLLKAWGIRLTVDKRLSSEIEPPWST